MGDLVPCSARDHARMVLKGIVRANARSDKTAALLKHVGWGEARTPTYPSGDVFVLAAACAVSLI